VWCQRLMRPMRAWPVIVGQEGGPIALLQNGDPVVIDARAEKRTIDVLISPEEMARRKVSESGRVTRG
jgi:dihydroxyacid dehydratase/phosphogluconate dehydratase